MIDRVQTYLGAGSSPNRNPLSSVSKVKRSSAAALKVPSTMTVSCINRLGFLSSQASARLQVPRA